MLIFCGHILIVLLVSVCHFLPKFTKFFGGLLSIEKRIGFTHFVVSVGLEVHEARTWSLWQYGIIYELLFWFEERGLQALTVEEVSSLLIACLLTFVRRQLKGD